MIRRTQIIILTMILPIFAFSQEAKPGADLSEVRKNKNHIDIDVKNIFNGLGNATILYKRSFNIGNLVDVNSIKLVRFSARYNGQITFTEDPTRDPNDTTQVAFHPSDVLDIQVGIGYEKQKMKGRFVHYYGVDLTLNYLKNDDDFSNGTIGGITINSTRTTDRLIEVMRTGLNPFFGVKFYFTPRISLGIETGLSILYFRQSLTEIGFEDVLVNGQFEEVFVEDEPVKSSGIQTRFNNLKFLTVGYTF